MEAVTKVLQLQTTYPHDVLKSCRQHDISNSYGEIGLAATVGKLNCEVSDKYYSHLTWDNSSAEKVKLQILFPSSSSESDRNIHEFLKLRLQVVVV